jgi:hypothetical protein
VKAAEKFVDYCGTRGELREVGLTLSAKEFVLSFIADRLERVRRCTVGRRSYLLRGVYS